MCFRSWACDLFGYPQQRSGFHAPPPAPCKRRRGVETKTIKLPGSNNADKVSGKSKVKQEVTLHVEGERPAEFGFTIIFSPSHSLPTVAASQTTSTFPHRLSRPYSLTPKHLLLSSSLRLFAGFSNTAVPISHLCMSAVFFVFFVVSAFRSLRFTFHHRLAMYDATCPPADHSCPCVNLAAMSPRPPASHLAREKHSDPRWEEQASRC